MKEGKTRHRVHAGLGILIAVAAIFIFLISSFEIGAYADYGFYEKEYEKYQVADDLGMDMWDIMKVTRYMMSYLRGGEDVLSIEAYIEGVDQDFFNEQDRFHMGEVRELFLGGLMLRRIVLIILVAAAVFLIKDCKEWKVLLSKMYQRTLAVFLSLTVILGILFSQDFNKYFVIFHHIFFDNDQWIFDPATDYMIRMLPEGFFYDMVMRIGVIFILFLLLFLAVSITVRVFIRKKQKACGQ
ncbi:MAG: TIGR01906 family membrane protein [Coprococcus sp.]|nr:TIGR01906 family membrane protein [Coprococcus sp.]